MGYSVGKWDGDEFVVTTAGMNDQVWNIDLAGHPHSDALKITERYRRVDFGHMDIQVTIDDSKTYTKPWNMPVMRYTLLPDTDLFEFVCEKNIDPQHMVGKQMTFSKFHCVRGGSIVLQHRHGRITRLPRSSTPRNLWSLRAR